MCLERHPVPGAAPHRVGVSGCALSAFCATLLMRPLSRTTCTAAVTRTAALCLPYELWHGPISPVDRSKRSPAERFS